MVIRKSIMTLCCECLGKITLLHKHQQTNKQKLGVSNLAHIMIIIIFRKLGKMMHDLVKFVCFHKSLKPSSSLDVNRPSASPTQRNCAKGAAVRTTLSRRTTESAWHRLSVPVNTAMPISKLTPRFVRFSNRLPMWWTHRVPCFYFVAMIMLVRW